MASSLDISLVGRGALYLKAIGFAPTEAQGKALSVWSSLNEEHTLADFMAQIRALAAQATTCHKHRPLTLGHMPTADFQKKSIQ